MATSYKDYCDVQVGFGETPTPEAWWNQWSSEKDRSWLISRLQPKEAARAHSYGLANTWKTIPAEVQNLLIQV